MKIIDPVLCLHQERLFLWQKYINGGIVSYPPTPEQISTEMAKGPTRKREVLAYFENSFYEPSGLWMRGSERCPSGPTPWAQREFRRDWNRAMLNQLGLTPRQFSVRFHVPTNTFSKLIRGGIDIDDLKVPIFE